MLPVYYTTPRTHRPTRLHAHTPTRLHSHHTPTHPYTHPRSQIPHPEPPHSVLPCPALPCPILYYAILYHTILYTAAQPTIPYYPTALPLKVPAENVKPLQQHLQVLHIHTIHHTPYTIHYLTTYDILYASLLYTIHYTLGIIPTTHTICTTCYAQYMRAGQRHEGGGGEGPCRRSRI